MLTINPRTDASGAVTLATLIIFNLTVHTCFAQAVGETKRRVMENLGRGVVALHQGNGKVFVSWRLLGTDPEGIAFNLYRATGDRSPVKVNSGPITRSTHFVDNGVDLSRDAQAYFIRSLVDGREGPPTARFVLAAKAPVQEYLAVPLKTPAGYTANDAAVGDLDGDGEYEIIIKQEMRGYDNSQRGVCPGTTKLEAYKLDGTFLWRIDLGKNIREGAHYTPFGQGNHNLSIGDVDGDGKDEIVYGAMCLDDNGTPLYNTRLGHGDAIHLSDIDPDRPGLEVFDIHEHVRHAVGAEFRDARTGQLIWGKPSPDVWRGVALDIDPRHRGYEMWASGPGLTGLWNVKGQTIADRKPRSCNFGVWWDGDLLRELLDRTTISKWNWQDQSEQTLLSARGCASNNSTKATPCLCADILGDWREEVIWRAADSRELRIYTTTIPTDHRLYTLMHDPTYRISVALQNVGYNQPTQPGYYLGDGMKTQPRPAIATAVAPK